MTVLLWVLLLQATPGATWDEKKPEQVGLVREKLDALRDLVKGHGCVVRRGALVYSWGDPSRSGELDTAIRPLLATLLLMAVDEGKVTGLDARVSDVEPRLTGKDAGITWRQLANNTSGFGTVEAPGAVFADDERAQSLYLRTLTANVFGLTGTEALKQRLGVALGFQDPMTLGALSPRDFARVGLLILRGGTWGERQGVSAPLTYLSISAPLPASTPRRVGKDFRPLGPGYLSFGWWLNGVDEERRQLFVDGPGDLVAALGRGGKRALWILPALDLVVS